MKYIFTRFLSISILSLAVLLLPKMIYCQNTPQEYYQMKIYRIDSLSQEKIIDDYLQNAYVPALHRAGIPLVGVFKPVESDENAGRLIYVFVPFKSLNQFLELPAMLQKDDEYQNTGAEYINAAHVNPPYNRFESIILKAFSEFPVCKAPEFNTPLDERIYELRSYESPTEKYYEKKIEMFNKGGETIIFRRLGFQPVFFAEVLSGSHMPNLMYMTSFSDKSSRDEHWRSFSDDPEWKKLKAMEKYQNTVSKADIYFLHPTAYSDF